MNKYLFKKCKQCINYNKETKYCNYYNCLAKEKCLNCQYDKRILCDLCSNYDKEKSYCNLLTTNKFKDSNTLRVCNNFNLKEI